MESYLIKNSNFALRIFTLLILLFFAIERILVSLRFRKDHPISFLSKILYVLPASTYIISILSSYVETVFSNYNFYLPISLIGAFVFVTGITLRSFSIKALGENWSFHLEPRPISKLVTKGPYSFSRHPYYFSVALELIGFAILLNAYKTLFFIILVHSPFLILRARFEERFSIIKYGRKYIEYQRTTNSLAQLPKFILFKEEDKSSKNNMRTHEQYNDRLHFITKKLEDHVD